ncbi:MAG: histidine ammonia-lyase [Euryarchaeota archaeon]|nr:histidine ammonia-lyase [Euryarchaeota archaeon]|tara:strand:- start:793 stop:2316 length:1524 start_codon:yes stop_codon:yes gene_type:complete
MRDIVLDGESLKIRDVVETGLGRTTVHLSNDARKRMEISRLGIDHILESGETTYGINTGFGALSSVSIESDKLEALQVNLIRSHACGIGEEMENKHTLMMMLIRANTLCRGNSGARPLIVDTLISMINHKICPIIPRIGSLGASGDLAPLSHLAMGMMGEGFCNIMNDDGNWIKMPALDALKKYSIEPIIPAAKEGLSLINGTSQMCAFMCEAIHNLDILCFASDASTACTVEAIRGSHKPFDKRIHLTRPHPGQSVSAARISSLLVNSEIMISHQDCERVQDAYSLRCSPQVHGPVIDVLKESRRILGIEINSSTDNPLIFTDGGIEVISGGNFHGQYIAICSDSMAVACHELASISERRINQILDPKWGGHSPFLTDDEGLESGLMIIQYSSAAVLSELHLMAGSATISNIPVSMGKEDHASMGATGSFRTMNSTRLLSNVIANEMICACEALERISERPGSGVAKIRDWVRGIVPPLDGDRQLSDDTRNLSRAILEGGLTGIFE